MQEIERIVSGPGIAAVLDFLVGDVDTPRDRGLGAAAAAEIAAASYEDRPGVVVRARGRHSHTQNRTHAGRHTHMHTQSHSARALTHAVAPGAVRTRRWRAHNGRGGGRGGTALPRGGRHFPLLLRPLPERRGGHLPPLRRPTRRGRCAAQGAAPQRARGLCRVVRACWVGWRRRRRVHANAARAVHLWHHARVLGGGGGTCAYANAAHARAARVTCPAQLAWRVPCLGGSAPADVLLEVCCWSSCACVFLCVRLCAYVCVWQFASVSFCVPCCVCVVWVCVG